MKNVIISLSMILFFCFLSYSQQDNFQSYEPLDKENWGKYEKFAEREQVMENMINTLSTVHKIKIFYKSNYPVGLSKEAFKSDFLQSKSGSSKKKEIENEMLFVFNKLQSKRNDKSQITKETIFNSMIEMAFEPELNGLAEVAYKGKLNKQPPGAVAIPMYNQARLQLMGWEVRRCQQALKMCLALSSGSLALTGDLILANGGLFWQTGGTAFALGIAGIGTAAAAVAVAIAIVASYQVCKVSAQRCFRYALD